MYMNSHGEEVKMSSQQDQAYKALYRAAERIGLNNYITQKTNWLKTNKTMKSFKFSVTAEHDELVKAMPQVLSGIITPDEAMALLWQYETMNQRFGSQERRRK